VSNSDLNVRYEDGNVTWTYDGAHLLSASSVPSTVIRDALGQWASRA
jgi:hypothetical protein